MLLALKKAWLMCGVALAMLVLLEGTCRMAVRLRGELTAPDTAHTDAYGNAEWTVDYFREFREADQAQWHPYVYWRRKPFKGQWINVDVNGVRRTWRATHEAPHEARRIFCFGGSTMWGTGARDEFTIPSFLARQLDARQLPADVTNFGESGYVSTQCLLALMNELNTGNVPDVVVFYDGVNDTYSAYQNQVAGIPQNELHRRREFNGHKKRLAMLGKSYFPGLLCTTGSLTRRWAASSAPREFEPHAAQQRHDQLADDVIRHYKANLESIDFLAHRHGFQALYYWQPTVFHKTVRSPDEARFSCACERLLQSVYERVECDSQLRARTNFHNVSHIFANEATPQFIDWCHLAEQGNERIARRMTADIGVRLLAPAWSAPTQQQEHRPQRVASHTD